MWSMARCVSMSSDTHAWRAAAAALGSVIAVLVLATAARAAPALRPGIWVTPAELRGLPESGAAWEALKQTADENVGTPHLNGKNSTADVHALAAALVYARTGDRSYADKALVAVMGAIGSERKGRTLSLARGLQSYVVAADLIDLPRLDPAKDRVFRAWLSAVRTEHLRPSDTPTLITTHERRPNNWGTHAGASRMAADVYLGDAKDLARAAAVFKGWLGDRASYHGFQYGSLSWQADPKAPVAIDPKGATRGGRSIDGALADDMRRGCGLKFPPCPTGYPWEAMQGAVVQAEILHRQGYDSWNWGHRALLRAVRFLADLNRRYPGGGWGVSGDDTWIPWLINARYGTRLPTVTPTQPGKGMGFTDWTLAAASSSGRGTAGPATVRHRAAGAASGTRGAAKAARGGSSSPAVGFVVALVLVVLLVAAAVVATLLRHRARRPRPIP